MIVKLLAYEDEFHEEQDNPNLMIRTDEVTLPEVIEVMQDFLEAAGWVFPDGYHLGYEED